MDLVKAGFWVSLDHTVSFEDRAMDVFWERLGAGHKQFVDLGKNLLVNTMLRLWSCELFKV